MITVLPFSPTGAVLNCTVFIWWIYGASQHRMPSSLSILTPKQINLWFLFDEVFLCRKLIRWYWYSDQKNPRSWCKPSDTETYNALPTLPGIQRSELNQTWTQHAKPLRWVKANDVLSPNSQVWMSLECTYFSSIPTKF